MCRAFLVNDRTPANSDRSPSWRTKQQTQKAVWDLGYLYVDTSAGVPALTFAFLLSFEVRHFSLGWTCSLQGPLELLNCVHLLMYYIEASSIFIEYIRSMCHSVPPLCHLPNSFQPHKIGELLEQNKLRSHDTKYCTTSSFHEFPQLISIPAEKYPSKYAGNLNFL